MAYKKLIKVSNVCQLLDKRKYPATQTSNGVTFTNNGDGTITVNGTATSTAFFLLFSYSDSLIPGHKYLLFGSPNDASANAYIQCYDMTNDEWLRDIGGGSIAIFPKKVVRPDQNTFIRIRIANSYTANNLVFKPQLFDLTEMYGAGNEPATVEEFKSKFPNDLYDYSPYCWLTSYKRVFMTGGGNYLTSYQRNLTCKTKNLFDISKVVPGNIYVTFDSKDITCSWYGCSIGLLKNVCPSLKVGDVVTLSFKIKSTTGVAPTIVQIQGQVFDFSVSAPTFTVTEEGLNSNFYFYNTTFENRDVLTTTVFTDIMIELGDTATNYVPYGHL